MPSHVSQQSLPVGTQYDYLHFQPITIYLKLVFGEERTFIVPLFTTYVQTQYHGCDRLRVR